MIVPIAVMVLSMPLFLYVTGEEDISAGSGSTSVLWAVLSALAVLWIEVLYTRRAWLEELMSSFLQGAGAFLPVSMILLFALALGDVANLLQTGSYVAQIAGETVPQNSHAASAFSDQQLYRLFDWVKLGNVRNYDPIVDGNCAFAQSVTVAIPGGGAVRLGFW